MPHEADRSFQAGKAAPFFEPPDPGKPISGDFVADGHGFSLINRYDVSAPAGRGQIVASEAVVERIALSRSWLLAHGLSQDMCGLVRVEGSAWRR